MPPPLTSKDAPLPPHSTVSLLPLLSSPSAPFYFPLSESSAPFSLLLSHPSLSSPLPLKPRGGNCRGVKGNCPCAVCSRGLVTGSVCGAAAAAVVVVVVSCGEEKERCVMERCGVVQEG